MINEYLLRMKYNEIEPNFFCSREYFEKANLEEKYNNLSFWYSFENKVMFPPIPSYSEFYKHTNEIWLGLEGIKIPNKWKREFFDYEFIYDSKNFLNMSGGNWATFRKNVRKFPKRYNGSCSYFLAEDYEPDEFEIKELFLNWMERESIIDIHDPDIALEYLLYGENRAFLVDDQFGILLGVNIWDFNWKYINFRFSFYDPQYSPWFLSEYLRYLFYTSEICLGDRRLINDGGCLDNKNLYNFKLKMNPVEIRKMWSWKKI